MSADGRIYLSPPWTDAAERRAVEAAFESKYIAPCGPMVDEFERRLGSLSGLSAAAVSSGTAALDLLMDEFGVGPGTFVFAPSLTFIATVGPAANTADVMRLRSETAAKLFAKIDSSKVDAPTLCALLEVISYCKEAPYTDALKKVCCAYKAQVEAMDDAALDKAKGDLNSVKSALAVLRRNNVIGEDCNMCKLLDSIWARKGWNKKK